MKPRDLLSIAAAIAKREPSRRGHMLMAAVGIRPDQLMVSSYNVQVPAQRAPHGHAEYRLHSKLQAGSLVAVARVTRDGEWAMAKPCAACEAILRNMRVSKIVYTICPGEFGTIVVRG